MKNYQKAIIVFAVAIFFTVVFYSAVLSAYNNADFWDGLFMSGVVPVMMDIIGIIWLVSRAVKQTKPQLSKVLFGLSVWGIFANVVLVVYTLVTVL